MERKICFEKVVQALKLCGPEYHATSCDECPYKKHCVQQGSNAPLLEDAAALLLDMRKDIHSILKVATATFEKASIVSAEYADKSLLSKSLNIKPEKGEAE